jgi:hypothetical protein
LQLATDHSDGLQAALSAVEKSRYRQEMAYVQRGGRGVEPAVHGAAPRGRRSGDSEHGERLSRLSFTRRASPRGLLEQLSICQSAQRSLRCAVASSERRRHCTCRGEDPLINFQQL